MRAPAPSLSPTTGAPTFSARSISLWIFSANTSPSAPPNTVKSWLKTNTLRPSTVPHPVITPSVYGRSSSPAAWARWRASMSSSWKLSGSRRYSMRSRASILPFSCWRSTDRCEPACSACSRRWRRSAILSSIGLLGLLGLLGMLTVGPRYSTVATRSHAQDSSNTTVTETLEILHARLDRCRGLGHAGTAPRLGRRSADGPPVDNSLICTTAPTVAPAAEAYSAARLRALLIASARAAPITASASSTKNDTPPTVMSIACSAGSGIDQLVPLWRCPARSP